MQAQDIPYGYCRCGCGGATVAYLHGPRKGKLRPYLVGHHTRKHHPGYRVDEATGCWEWTGRISANGYGGVVNPSTGRTAGAHRVIYERERGPIPEGLHIDHLCRNKACVNPDHLEVVTHSENVQRAWDARGRRGTMTQINGNGRWRAIVEIRTVRHTVGYFDSPDEAREALARFIAATE